MNVHNLESYLDGLGFSKPSADTIKTEGGGFISAPIVGMAPPTALITSKPLYDPAYIAESDIPFYDESRRFQYTSEQIQEMIDRGKSMQDEFTNNQYDEFGDGFADDLEQQAGEENATEKAIDDFASGNGLPTTAAPIITKEIGPLIALGALAYFLL